MHCFPLLRRRMVVQNLFEAVRKSFSMASPNSSHVRVFASVTATAALRLACRYLPAASGVPQAKKFDGIPHRRCPPAGSGIAATAGTNHLAATALVGRLNNGGVEHGPLGLNVPRLPRYMVKALPEVGVEALSDRRLCQTFPADPHDTFGSASSAPLFARVSKTCGRKSDDTTTKSIIELRPRVSWCQAQTTVRIRPPTRRRREAILSSTGVNSNILAPSRGAISIATPARRLSPVATPEWKRVQPLSRRLVPEPLLCVEVRPTISSRNFSTSRTSSGSFPTREVTFHVPRASFCSRGSDRQGPRLRPPPSSHCTRPLRPLLLVVSRREGGPTSSFRAVPRGYRPGHQALAAEPHPQAWLQGEAPVCSIVSLFLWIRLWACRIYQSPQRISSRLVSLSIIMWLLFQAGLCLVLGLVRRKFPELLHESPALVDPWTSVDERPAAGGSLFFNPVRDAKYVVENTASNT
ncbi:hypothetical protein N1851_007770 [Merluccius polli]|uniref:Uncharacterized protein n=1 Tax=Merluccius polli TaxID=89951 RepID=A0AA47N2L0_MERPO|nr:hypothetical protein N1851_007770 [Merluccius polli]